MDRRRRHALSVLLGLDLLALVWVVWTPASVHTCGPDTPFAWLLCAESPALHYAENLLLLVPTAVLAALRWPHIRRMRIALAMLALTCVIELVQRWIPGRDPDIYDVLTNAGGAWAALMLVRPRRSQSV